MGTFQSVLSAGKVFSLLALLVLSLSLVFSASGHREKMGASEGREDGSLIPFQREPRDLVRAVPVSWLSLHYNEMQFLLLLES